MTRRLQKKTAPTDRKYPVIMLTAKSEEDNKIKVSKWGCWVITITKPFLSTWLVLLRLNSILRRATPQGRWRAYRNRRLGPDPIPAAESLLVLAPLRNGTQSISLLKFLIDPPRRAFIQELSWLDQVWVENVYVWRAYGWCTYYALTQRPLVAPTIPLIQTGTRYWLPLLSAKKAPYEYDLAKPHYYLVKQA